MLNIFQNEISKTYQLKCVPFLLFQLSALSSAFLENFCQTLINTIIKRNSAISKEQIINSFFYVGSLLSRGQFISASFLNTQIKSLLVYASNYLEANKVLFQNIIDPQQQLQKNDVEEQEAIRQHYLLFYLVQVVMYIYCFKSDEIDGANSEQFLSIINNEHFLNFKQVIYKRILIEFGKVAKNSKCFSRWKGFEEVSLFSNSKLLARDSDF